MYHPSNNTHPNTCPAVVVFCMLFIWVFGKKEFPIVRSTLLLPPDERGGLESWGLYKYCF